MLIKILNNNYNNNNNKNNIKSIKTGVTYGISKKRLQYNIRHSQSV